MSPTHKRSYGKPRPPKVLTPRRPVSSWPFQDGFAWDDELVRMHERALSTHGPYRVARAQHRAAARSRYIARLIADSRKRRPTQR